MCEAEPDERQDDASLSSVRQHRADREIQSLRASSKEFLVASSIPPDSSVSSGALGESECAWHVVPASKYPSRRATRTEEQGLGYCKARLPGMWPPRRRRMPVTRIALCTAWLRGEATWISSSRARHCLALEWTATLEAGRCASRCTCWNDACLASPCDRRPGARPVGTHVEKFRGGGARANGKAFLRAMSPSSWISHCCKVLGMGQR